ncbi:hypothetical protein [Mitsuaria sp. 7]|uniref:hypothetical protein n=1 Tax=Mitsuaria sp. 7 TaxID=1658665 RepID=UPI0007DD278F|nr:hypothetical protein [Mitsuaria sp. 7]ANH68463.1 hypothetical protein ABE85_14410 [Mitsuaria sp. 7]
MLIRTRLANIIGLRIDSFDLVFVTAPATDVGAVIYQRPGLPTRRVLHVEGVADDREAAAQAIRRELDPSLLSDGWKL